MKVTLREVIIAILIVLVIFAGMRFSLQGFGINGPCMEPYVHNGQDWLVNKISYHFHDPQRGDVIVLHAPDSEGTLLIKRVIGLPGDTIEVRDGQIYITEDGKRTVLKEESANVASPLYQMSPVTVPPGEYFVLGDNRNNSADSHVGWVTSKGVLTHTVPRENIVGKAWLCYWPPSEWRLCPTYSWNLV